MITKKATFALKTAALGGLILWACLRERTEAERPPRPIRPAEAAAGAEPAPPRKTVEQEGAAPPDPFHAATQEVAADLRRLQERRQREWAAEVDQQTRLEWMERYDEERQALVKRLEPFVSAEFLADIDTWAATQRGYGKP